MGTALRTEESWRAWSIQHNITSLLISERLIQRRSFFISGAVSESNEHLSTRLIVLRDFQYVRVRDCEKERYVDDHRYHWIIRGVYKVQWIYRADPQEDRTVITRILDSVYLLGIGWSRQLGWRWSPLHWDRKRLIDSLVERCSTKDSRCILYVRMRDVCLNMASFPFSHRENWKSITWTTRTQKYK